jgi:hypothetical protein
MLDHVEDSLLDVRSFIKHLYSIDLQRPQDTSE